MKTTNECGPELARYISGQNPGESVYSSGTGGIRGGYTQEQGPLEHSDLAHGDVCLNTYP